MWCNTFLMLSCWGAVRKSKQNNLPIGLPNFRFLFCNGQNEKISAVNTQYSTLEKQE